MLKTYLYIPETLEHKIIFTAKILNKSKAEVIRLALEKGINTVRQQGTASAQLLLKLGELGKKSNFQGPKDSSDRMDELLWGKEWNEDE